MVQICAGHTLRGLYVILDPSVSSGRSLTDVLKGAAAGGARLFQYRNKSPSMKEAYAEALPLSHLARDLGATFIINDRCDLALAVEAAGVHLGQTDLPYDYARKVMGPSKLIGLSTHTAEQVQEAERLKPDYIGYGPIFKPGSKQDHDPVVGIEGLRQIRSLTALPIFAIGGIQVDDIDNVIRAAADGIAVVSAVLTAPDVTSAVRAIISRMEQAQRPAS
jgi:thiamine-phosphate pyrophosphorylase